MGFPGPLRWAQQSGDGVDQHPAFLQLDRDQGGHGRDQGRGPAGELDREQVVGGPGDDVGDPAALAALVVDHGQADQLVGPELALVQRPGLGGRDRQPGSAEPVGGVAVLNPLDAEQQPAQVLAGRPDHGRLERGRAVGVADGHLGPGHEPLGSVREHLDRQLSPDPMWA